MTVTRRTPVQWKTHSSTARPLISITKDGEPVEGLVSERIISLSVEEEVLNMANAGHIHAWFLRNVKGLKDAGYTPQRITMWDLDKLLAACEKVLFGSQLVPAEAFSKGDYDWRSSEAKQAVGSPRKVIKNVNVAHRELPVDTKNGGNGEYDDEYLKAVEDTRNWIARMKSERTSGPEGEFFYSLNYRY